MILLMLLREQKKLRKLFQTMRAELLFKFKPEEHRQTVRLGMKMNKADFDRLAGDLTIHLN